jgi:hypothetical protein
LIEAIHAQYKGSTEASDNIKRCVLNTRKH